MKHRQTSVQTWRYAWETIQPDCEMDIPVTVSDKNGTEKFDVALGEVPSEGQSNMIFMGHQISSCHVLVVRSFFIFWKTLLSS
jgi:hypothetical protein